LANPISNFVLNSNDFYFVIFRLFTDFLFFIMAQKKIWEFIQIKPKNPHEGEEELTLQLLGSSIEEINNIKRK
jgi:hypothetical protein